MIAVVFAPPLLSLGIVGVQREIRRRQELAKPHFPINLSILSKQNYEPDEVHSQADDEPSPNSQVPASNPPKP